MAAFEQTGKDVESVVQRQQVEPLFGEVIEHLVQRQPPTAASALVGGPPAGVIDQYPAHGPGRHSEELAPRLGVSQGVGV